MRAALTLPVILTGAFMGILDFFIVNVTIPSIEHGLHTSSAQVEFIVAGYALTYAVGLIIGGRLGDLYGHRRMFAIGMTAFVLTSLACGLSVGPVMLVLCRAAQGLAAAALTPQVLSILSMHFTGAARERAFAAFGATLGAAAVCGQLIGGLLLEWDLWGLSWRLCFLINVPVGVAALCLVRHAIPGAETSSSVSPDWNGMLIITVALSALIVPLVLGRQTGWPLWSIVCMLSSVPMLGVFVTHQRARTARARTPLVELSLLRSRPFVVGLLIVLIFYSGLASFFLVLALYLQQGAGVSPIVAGVVFVPLGVGFMLASRASAHVNARLGRQALCVGAVLMAISYPLLWSCTTGSPTWWLLAASLLVNGLGEGLVMTLLVATVMSHVPRAHAGSGSGLLSTTQQFASALGVALIGMVYYHLAGSGVATAFHGSLLYACVLLVLVALAVQALPARPKAAVN